MVARAAEGEALPGGAPLDRRRFDGWKFEGLGEGLSVLERLS